MLEIILEAKDVAEVVAREGISLYKKGEINGDDLSRIFIAVQSIFEYLNNVATALKEFKSNVTEDVVVKEVVKAKGESLILKAGMEDALQRARAYIEAGVDAIVIHSKEKTPDEVFQFCR